MKEENKRSIMVWAIVVLAVMNVTTLATLLYHQYRSGISVTGTKQLEANTEKFSGRYFRDQLHLSSDQVDKFREVNQGFRPQARAITMELAQKRNQMLVEMASVKSDTAKLNMLSDSIGYLHSRLKKLTYKYYLDIKDICNKEQQQKLEQLVREMFVNDAPMGFPGKGGMHGMGPGKGKKLNFISF
jgi:Spy/CpxP family protein refolding chaperone